jgi:hypothetical protein
MELCYNHAYKTQWEGEMNIKMIRKILFWVFILCMVGVVVYVLISASRDFNTTIMVLIMVVGFAAIIAHGILGIVANNQRKAALRQMASERGLAYNQEVSDITSLLGGILFEMTSVGHYKRVRNVMAGQWHGSAVKIFDLHYITGTGKNQSSHRQTGIALAADELSVPEFVVKPEHLFSKLANALGQKEIDFEEDPDFSKQFQLMSMDEAAVRLLFSPIVREWFKHHRGICAELRSSQLLLYKQEKILEVEELLQLLDDGAVLIRQFKR